MTFCAAGKTMWESRGGGMDGVLLGGPSQDAETSFASLSALKKKFN